MRRSEMMKRRFPRAHGMRFLAEPVEPAEVVIPGVSVAGMGGMIEYFPDTKEQQAEGKNKEPQPCISRYGCRYCENSRQRAAD